jgi:predicted transcriptional regulator
VLTSEQIRAGRMLLRWEQKDLATSSKLSLATIKRLEVRPGPMQANQVTIAAIERAFSEAGVEFTNGDTPGVRLQGKR